MSAINRELAAILREAASTIATMPDGAYRAPIVDELDGFALMVEQQPSDERIKQAFEATTGLHWFNGLTHSDKLVLYKTVRSLCAQQPSETAIHKLRSLSIVEEYGGQAGAIAHKFLPEGDMNRKRGDLALAIIFLLEGFAKRVSLLRPAAQEAEKPHKWVACETAGKRCSECGDPEWVVADQPCAGSQEAARGQPAKGGKS